MKFIQNFRVRLTDIGIDNELTNYGFLSFLENIAVSHSDTVGYGVKDIPIKHRAWLLLDWRLDVIKRPKFGTEITVRTNATNIERPTFHVYRNFEIIDNTTNEIIGTATSRWVLYDTENKRVVKVDQSYIDMYNPEGDEKEAEDKIPKLKEPNSYNYMTEYEVSRGDIDINHHMHNLNYLKLAYEIIPEEVFLAKEKNHLHIMYKHQILYGEKVKCFYAFEDGKHIVTIKNEDETKLHAMVVMY